MNKNVASLLFATAIGAASSQALAVCFESHRGYQANSATGFSRADRLDHQAVCNHACEL